mgnify:CR=1 FL=1
MTPALVTYTQREAAAALGCSVGFFRAHVLQECGRTRETGGKDMNPPSSRGKRCRRNTAETV